MSDGTTAAESRLVHSSVPYKLLNGTVVANDWGDLTDGNIISHIYLTELQTTTTSRYTWTGTDRDGSFSYSGNRCDNWTQNTYPAQGFRGQVGRYDTGIQWTEYNSDYCIESLPLYCFEQLTSHVLPSPTPTPTLAMPFRKALKLNGDSKIETFSNEFDNGLRENAVRIEAFVNPRLDTPTGTSPTTAHIVFKNGEFGLKLNKYFDGTYAYVFWIANNNDSCREASITRYAGSVSEWHHIIAQYQYRSSGGEVNIWLDGNRTTQLVNT